MSDMELSIAVFGGHSVPALHATIASIRRATHQLLAERQPPPEIVLFEQPGAPTAHEHLADANESENLRFLPAERDIAASRAMAGAHLSGSHVAFLDAGDMWSSNFLVEALRAARREGSRASVWRPEAVVSCGRDYFAFDVRGVFQLPLLDTAAGALLLHECPYAPSFFAHRRILDAVSFPLPDARRGWHDVDAWWTANTLGAGFGQRILERTALYRWQSAADATDKARIGPSCLFAPELSTRVASL
ncbi:glycosyltransferase family A protein [Plastoroseomonas hellenica]|uniref:glycosyltransferase family A protein n=1 Tax=Plastoroseomonas hellenica TaxID=2687306 RepID=UPI001BAB4D82|nr:glycosyltransferase family A protein [Plastoroseomonas hellenica]MBR0641463.1 glycosyltransferase family 2 protein [Plastoroseomonas hellenica]